MFYFIYLLLIKKIFERKFILKSILLLSFNLKLL